MKKIGIIIIALSLLVGCGSNESSNIKDLNSQLEEKNDTKNTPSNTLENIHEDITEEINIKSTITFPSKDGLIITADTYIIDETSPFMILFHQANSSRGEYIETALEFNTLGFNVIAVDLRFGLKENEVVNETAQRAKDENFPNTMTDAGMDVQAAIEYVRDEYKSDSIYLLGSSYSSSLVLVIAPEYEDIIEGVLSFSPYVSLLWNDQKLSQSVDQVKAPVFLTSAKSESTYVDFLVPLLSSEIKVTFTPETRGRHGARSLWSINEDSSSYWEALIDFLEQVNQQ